jgi:TonB family protein
MVREPHVQWQAWATSVALHAAIVTVLAASSNQVIDATDPFHWDVTLLDDTIPAAETVEAGVSGDVSPGERKQEPPAEPMSKTSVKARAINRSNTHTPDPVEAVQPVHRPILDRAVVAREQPPLQEMKQPDNRKVKAELPSVVTESQVSEHSTTVSSGSATIERSDELQEHEVKRSDIRNIAKAEERPGLSGMTSAATAAIVTPGVVQYPSVTIGPDVVQQYPEVRSSSGLQQAVSSLVGGAGGDGREAANPVRQSGVGEGASIDTAADSREGQALSPVTSDVSIENRGPTAGASSTSGSGKGAGPDYGWLKRLLWESIDRVKQYSDDAVENEWEGRVVMAVTIRRDGRIEEVRVMESSGNRSLDREAQELMARASPLVLDRALGAEQVRLRVPISFGLE